MAVVSYPYPAQGCSQAGPIPTTRPRHYVATSPSTIADVDGAASPGSTASVNGAFYVKDDGGNWDAITGGGSAPDADAATKGILKLAHDIGGTAALPTVVGIHEIGSNTQLLIDTIADGQTLQRSGGNVLGYTPAILWELIENKEFSAHATSYDFSGLDGDAAEEYFFVYRLVKDASGAQNTYLRPNAITTNQRFRGRYTGASVGELNDTTGGILLSNNGGAANDVDTGVGWIHADKVVIRTGETSWTQATSAAELFRIMGGWVWNETSTNITSLRLISTATNGIGVNSYLRLYRLRKAAP